MKSAKKVLNLVFALVLITSTFTLVSADPGTEVGGPIISNTTWDLAHSPYIVVASIEVWEGVTLTIKPGVTVRFNSAKKMQVNGSLIARGTEGQPITFTSNQLSPAPGDWGSIEFTNTAVTTTMDAEGNYISGSILQYCIVEYGGANAESAIHVYSLLINHCIVRNNDARGIYNEGTADALSRIANNTVNGNLTSSTCVAYGGGVYANHSTVTKNAIRENSAKGSYDYGCGSYGGGVYVSNSTVTNNTVIGNSATGLYGYGGGISADESMVMDNTISGNSSRYHGGSIYAINSMVSNNTVVNNDDGAINARCSRKYAKTTVNGNTVSGNAGDGIIAVCGYHPHYYSDYGEITVDNNIVSDNNGDGIDAYADCFSDHCKITISGNTISGNDGSGIRAWFSFYSDYGEATISNNIVEGNSAPSKGGGIYANGYSGDITVVDNIVSDNSASEGGGICASSSTILSNTVTLNTVSDQGAGICFYGSGDLLNNTVIANTGPITLTVGGVAIDGTPEVHQNNFYGNSPYDVVVISSNDIGGTNNYWGTTESVDIIRQIYDWYDDSSRGKFLYIPYLQDPSLDAPFPPPTNLRADFHNSSLTLSWDGLPSFKTGWGYKVYYDSDSSLPPYEGTGLNEGNSPINVGSQTVYTLTSLEPGKTYYFAVTSYDAAGRESWYSNVESKVGEYRVYLPLVLKGH